MTRLEIMQIIKNYPRGVLALSLVAVIAVVLAACGEAATSSPAPSDDAVALSPAPATGTPVPSPEPTSETTEASPTPELRPEDVAGIGEVGSLAPELKDISGWFNTDPFTLQSLRGSVVLVDFWTYTCVNCIRTMPFLKEWHEKYSDRGLTIVGVHSPEFEFEKKPENVAEAIERHGLGWPMAQDNEMGTWRAFNNRFWPAKYLIDKDGIIRYRHFGEGSYDETEREIRKLLEEAGVDVSDIVAGTDPGPQIDSAARGGSGTGQTRELYAGITRNASASIPYIGNNLYYRTPPGTPADYEDPGDHLNHFLFLHGNWINEFESVKHGRQTEGLDDYLALKFYGTSANVVISFEDAEPFDVVITLDGQPVPEEKRGSDILVGDDGMTFLKVDTARMYNVIQSPEYGGHDITLSSNSDDFSVFAFTFGSYDRGP